ncbi:MAG: type II secretion system protein [Nitrospirota bacterium]
MKRESVSPRCGFTLLEVMISLAIVGGLLITLIYTLNYHLGIAEKHEALTVATMLAKKKLTEIEEGPPRETKGEFPEPYAGYHYVAEIGESRYPGLSEISVTINKDNEKIKFSELIEAKNENP